MRQLVSSGIVSAGLLALLGAEMVGPARAAAPAATSYVNVENAIKAVRAQWARPDVPQDPNSPGWNAFFDALLNDLNAYSRASSPAERLTPLNQIYQMSQALAVVNWPPAQQVREELRTWLRPRVRLAWAEKQLEDSVRNLPPTDNTAAQANRQRWVDFVDNDLGQALAQYNQATTVSQRQQGLNRIHEALKALQSRNNERPWQPSSDLQNAVNGLFNQPNIDITADVSFLQPFLDQNLVTSGPVYRKGYWSQVTAGPKLGFGLLPSDNGISFYNMQSLTSVTPITDFQQQIAQDPQGQRAAKLYYFSATTYDYAQLTVYAMISAAGLSLTPAYNHAIDAAICSAPTPDGGFGRLVAGLIGMNQGKINQKVYEGALPKFRQQIPQEAQEEAQERIGVEQSQRNAELSRYLIGNQMIQFQDLLITGVSLRSRPQAIYVGGLLQSKVGDRQRGADAPQPSSLAVPDPGLCADVHLASVANGALDWIYQRPDVQSIDNILIETKDVPPGTPPRDAVTITKNVDYPTYSKAVDRARAANNPKVTALRVFRPKTPPEFAVDARGFLVAIVHDFRAEAPAPDKSTQAGSLIGVPARILRIEIPVLEVALSYQIEQDAQGPHLLKAKVEDFSPSTDAKVIAINTDPEKGTTLSRFSGALVISALGVRLRSQPITAGMDNLRFRGLAVQSVSPLDPTGWVRVTLAKTPAPTPLPKPAADAVAPISATDATAPSSQPSAANIGTEPGNGPIPTGQPVASPQPGAQTAVVMPSTR
jgi:hypothetical protein